MREDEDRLTDTQERALIALSELPPEGTTWRALHRFGYVETHESSVRQLEVRITDNGRALLASMGD